ncbi:MULTISPECIES: aspartate-alanine antiporter [Pandoraea]|uniref:Transporter n=1 Tax=Pandoraea pnomenusa TaxID=93220 RepID=A0ABY6WGI1_9BURK|nr:MULTISPECIES: aspartate-alanine antiporter [Pandoraea]AHB06781.1 transporter [Pandoraea pnomenusa 3kgm]AHB77105.1 aspartate-alanine antiporter [Pandoraea pnomenusa]AHN74507.1 aspartate-alanine antiporter [Pandoraea pnomenusa]ANC45884.1 aspartate-alanine antiporter [Pandoraea pnomenusa]QDH59048.1 aspartate-alanine antiporter [Pandoraea pnomenusa]
MELVHSILNHVPEVAIFLSLALGYAIGAIKFGSFQLGGVGGSLLVAVVVSQIGISVDAGVKSIMFALFIYAVGYESGPQFFSSLSRKTLREIAMAVFLAASGLVTVLICAKLFGFDKGLAAGVAGGGLTQSAIIGTAGDAISRLGLPVDEVKRLQSEVAIGYAVTYIFGSLGAIIVCASLVPRLMGRTLKEDAKKAELAMAGGRAVLSADQVDSLPALVGRVYRVTTGAGKRVIDVEKQLTDGVTIERLRRKGKIIIATDDLVLEAGDDVMLIGRREAATDAWRLLGDEQRPSQDLDIALRMQEVVFARKGGNGKTLGELKAGVERDVKHGVYIAKIMRMGQPVPVLDDTVVYHGDVVTLYGADSDVQRAAKEAGYPVAYSVKTDYVYMGIGIVVGLLIGYIVVKVGGIPLTLGSGGGALLAGLVFGWLRGKHPTFGAMPLAASSLLKELGLATFVTCVGLSAGAQAWQTLQQSGVSIFIAGVIVTIVPLLLTYLFGRYVLRYDNVAILAGALSGSRSANPAFGEILDKAESNIPTVPFAITYAIANVLLTLLGPLVVSLA